jgi:hypothetical protein
MIPFIQPLNRFGLACAQRLGWAFDQPTPKDKS